MTAVKIAETTFEARVVREYSSQPTVDDLGIHMNKATLYKIEPDENYYIVEWEAGPEGVSVGIWTDAQKMVTDYDGVFDLSPYIVKFLTEQGFDCSEIVK